MKRIYALLLVELISLSLFAQSYKIVDYKFNITKSKGINFGKTKEPSLLMKCPIDNNTVFSSEDSFKKYLSNYEQQLLNTRAFDSVNISYDSVLDKENNINNIILYIDLVDSNHLLALPYPKFSSNSGLTLKLKAKDTNFLGTLNPLATDLYFNYKDNFEFGINFGYDYPFKAGIFNATWENSLNLSYIIGDKNPEFSTRIGVGFTLPKDFYSINFGAFQTIGYTDKIYFKENLTLSVPLVLYKANNFTNINYSPSVDFSFNWDKDLFNGKTAPLNCFDLSFGHSISNSKIDWNNKFRKGYSFNLGNYFVYNLQKNEIYPSLNFEAQYFNNFKLLNGNFLDRMGINSRLYLFTVIDLPNRENIGNQNIANRLRGILDNKLPKYPCGIVLNLDFPVSIVTTNFPLKIINFNLQLSPFVDIAIPYNETELFDIKNGYYCGGMEILVNPLQFSSYTIRASIGFDLNAIRKADSFKDAILHNNEIYIGLDLHY